MSGIYFYDDAAARAFEPFALTRPASELLAGAVLQRERWAHALRLPALGMLGPPHLADFDERAAVHAAAGRIPAGSVIVNARFVPRLTSLPRAEEGPVDLWLSAGRAVAVRLSRELPVEHFASGRLTLDEVARSGVEAGMLEGWWLEHVWDLVRLLPAQLADDLAYLARLPEPGRPALSSAPGAFAPVPPHASVLGTHPVLLAADAVGVGERVIPGAVIEPHVVLDATAGPILIGAGSTVHAFTRLEGPCYVGRETSIVGDRIAGCAIGDQCRVRGEMSSSIMLGYANKGHHGFVGHSYLGRWVNLGAGTITSNLKNTYGPVSLWTPDGMRDTGMQFLGTFFGDHCKTAIGTRLTTGTVLGAGCNVFGSAMPPKVVPPFLWGDTASGSIFELTKFLEVAERVMARRQVELSETERRQLAQAHASRWAVERG
ncbi:MAG TPA: putative sugar nucleotidyl transferase [Gemmatimonadaceae bacterium]|nr:putative sugar nucleotidyl transferase [Gemmatimonadaceae bacterium]